MACQNKGVKYVPESETPIGRQQCSESNLTCPRKVTVIPAHHVPADGYIEGIETFVKRKLQIKTYTIECKKYGDSWVCSRTGFTVVSSVRDWGEKPCKKEKTSGLLYSKPVNSRTKSKTKRR